MKRIILLLIILWGLSVHRAEAQTYGWVDISENIPDFNGDTVVIGPDTFLVGFTDVFFTNDNEGWITVVSDPPIILHTTNGGQSWTEQAIGTYCEKIFMIDNLNGYAGGEDGLLWGTADGGDTWNLHGFTGSTTITGISFPPGSDTGYVCSDNNLNISQVQPSGISNIPIGGVNVWRDISAVAPGDFFFCGGIHMHHYSNQQFTQPLGDVCGYYQSLSFADPDHGFIVNECQVQGYRTDLQYLHKIGEFVPDSHHLRDVFALDSNHIWVVGYDGFILSSANAGDFGLDSSGGYYMNVVWDSSAAGITDNDLLSVFFTSTTNGFAVGLNKTLLKYSLLTEVKEGATFSAIKVFPNPSSGDFQIEFTSAKNAKAKIEIVNVLGEMIWEKDIFIHSGSNSISCGVNGMEAGIYFLRITNGENQVTQKIIIQ